MRTGPSSVYSTSSCMAMEEPSCGVGTTAAASWQWHIGVALAQCSSRRPAVHPGIRLQQATQVGPLQSPQQS